MKKSKRITRRKAKAAMLAMKRYHGLLTLQTPVQRAFKRELFLLAKTGVTKIHFSAANLSDYGTDAFLQSGIAVMQAQRLGHCKRAERFDDRSLVGDRP